MRRFVRTIAGVFRGWDEGTVALNFMLCFPILLWIMAIISQLALIINARIVLDHAVSLAARSAMVSLPTDPTVDTMYDGTSLDGELFVNRSARLELATISPPARDGATSEGTAVMRALQDAGLPINRSFADRYNFAAEATMVSWQRVDDSDQPIAAGQWQPSDFATHGAQRILLTIKYNFQLDIPLANALLSKRSTIAGVNGFFLPITSSYIVQLAPGREAQTDQSGYPIPAAAP